MDWQNFRDEIVEMVARLCAHIVLLAALLSAMVSVEWMLDKSGAAAKTLPFSAITVSEVITGCEVLVIVIFSIVGSVRILRAIWR